jgi:4-diphosphocytidyl-2-C-methyl-D-erythritol kinase
MPGVPLDRSNLVLRAVDVFRAGTGVARKFQIKLDKTVPAQAGLGGGSGNAATALWGVNELCRSKGITSVDSKVLLEWSKGLGSDATFFMSQGTAFCTGRGEVLTPLAPLPATDLYIFKPEVGLSTPEVFRALALGACSTRDPLALLGLHTTGAAGDDKFINDLEAPAFQCIPALADLKRKLASPAPDGYGFPTVSMSGSGTSLFALGSPADPNFAEKLAADTSLPWPVKVFKTSFLNRPAGSWYSLAA